MDRFRADLLLLLAALIWGTAFIAQKTANDAMGPVAFVGARFLVAALVLVPVAWIEARKTTAPPALRDIAIALAIGLCLFAGASLQQVGLLTTSVSNAGFLTALYVVFVPFVVWLLKGVRPRLVVLVAGAISILGAWLLAGQGRTIHLATGDMLIVLADLAWALNIALVPIFLARVDRPFLLSFFQYAVVAVLGVAGGLIAEPTSTRGILSAWPAILYAGVLSGGVAYTLQIIGQRHTPAAEAALILSLESVFAAVSGALWFAESLTPVATAGCVLILFGVLLVELGPVALRKAKFAVPVTGPD